MEVDDVIELLQFILTTTYFRFGGQLYRQLFGAAMGSPVSLLVADMYMEFLEQKAITTSPEEYKPRLWKRYIDDILEVLKKDAVEGFTEHFNSIDETGSIKFTYEMEHEGSLLFLDILITRQQNGQLKLTMYRKKTQTDQYLHFESHHPLEHKISVIRILVARSENLATDKCDKDKEMEHIKSALGHAVIRLGVVQRKMESAAHPQNKMKKSRLSKQVGSAKQVVIPYGKGLSEDLARVYRSHGANVVCIDLT